MLAEPDVGYQRAWRSNSAEGTAEDIALEGMDNIGEALAKLRVEPEKMLFRQLHRTR